MQKQNITLRKQFLTRIIAILLVISILSSGIQLYLMNKQVDYEIETQTAVIAQGVNKGIEETDLAAKSIEHQIDLKLVEISNRIELLLNKESSDSITNEELSEIKEKLDLAGVSIFARENNDIVVVKSTDPNEIGFSTRSIGEEVYGTNDQILKGENPQIPGALNNDGLAILPIVQSGTHKDEPQFFKYAYFHPNGTDYTINPYIKADEVYKFTKDVGPDSWIDEMEKENPFVKDISVLNPEIFQTPELESQFWPPVKKIVYGDFKYQSDNDREIITGMIDNPIKQSYVQTNEGNKILKLFLPLENGGIIHISFDYEKMTEPLYTQSIILIITGVVALFSIFFLIYKLFSKIYESIQKITKQIILLESGDLTAVSEVKDGSELSALSNNVNSMAGKLHHLVKKTQEQATKTQRLSLLLEEEASQSVEKIYEISTESTIKSREQLFEIIEFIDEVEQVLDPHNHQEEVQKILERVDSMKEIANERTATTTNITITLSDLLQSLHGQSQELSDISTHLLEQMHKFNLN